MSVCIRSTECSLIGFNDQTDQHMPKLVIFECIYWDSKRVVLAAWVLF